MRAQAPGRVRPARRGAAVVELAVSLTLLVSALFIALYAGEAFLAGARAQEAEIGAGWDLTAYRMHDYTVQPPAAQGRFIERARQVTSTVANREERELAGMNSFTRPDGRVGRRFVVSEQRLEDVTCAPFDTEPLAREARTSLLTFDGLPTTAWSYLHRGGYMSCQASVRFTSPYMPRRLRDGYAGRVDLLSERLRDGFRLCGLGATLQGCDTPGVPTRGFVVLTDDWAVENGEANPVGSEDNLEYFHTAQSVFLAGRPDDAGQDLEMPRPGEGGRGGQKVRNALLFLFDTERDDARTSYFKFGFLNPSSQQRFMAVDDGQDRAHLVPWDDGERSLFTNATENIARGQRSDHFYLGHYRADFNEP